MDSFQQIDRHDSRYAAKQKDIASTVKRIMAQQKKQQVDWENKLGDELVGATEEAVLKGGVNCVGYSRAYARNYDSCFKGDN